MTDIGKLKELESRATPGPWVHYCGKLREAFPTVINEVQFDDGKNAGPVIHWSGFDASAVGNIEREQNAAFIAALRNAAPSILARLEAADRVIGVARTMDAELDDVINTVLLIVSDQRPYFSRAHKRAIATSSRLRDAITTYDDALRAYDNQVK